MGCALGKTSNKAPANRKVFSAAYLPPAGFPSTRRYIRKGLFIIYEEPITHEESI